MYPYPKMPKFNGDREAAISLLRRVTLDKHRFICLELRSHVFDAVASSTLIGKSVNALQMYDNLGDLKEWIVDSLYPTISYEGWLQTNHGVLADETFPNENNAEYMPDKVKQSRLAWIAHMIATLEGKQ